MLDAAKTKAKKKDRSLSAFVFPSRVGSGHRIEIKKDWADLCRTAGIVTAETKAGADGKSRTIVKHSARPHDLRHTHASILASAGASLPLIGALLGHSQPATTARYAHLFLDAQRKAAETAASIIQPSGQGAENSEAPEGCLLTFIPDMSKGLAMAERLAAERRGRIQKLRLIDRADLKKRLRDSGALLEYKRLFLADIIDDVHIASIETALRNDWIAELYLWLEASKAINPSSERSDRADRPRQYGVSDRHVRDVMQKLSPERRQAFEEEIAAHGPRPRTEVGS